MAKSTKQVVLQNARIVTRKPIEFQAALSNLCLQFSKKNWHDKTGNFKLQAKITKSTVQDPDPKAQGRYWPIQEVRIPKATVTTTTPKAFTKAVTELCKKYSGIYEIPANINS